MYVSFRLYARLQLFGPKVVFKNNGAEKKPTPFEHALNSLYTHFATILAHSVLRMPQLATPLFLNNSTDCFTEIPPMNCTMPPFLHLFYSNELERPLGWA